MKIELKHIKLHGFLSFGDAELELDNKGFCSIVGINHNPNDMATSNGSGKSSLVSAIAWTLTGETIQGLKSNIANIYLDDGCYVELTFKVDNNEYIITRYKDDPKYKSNLKIIVNGEDKSGKGIKESEAILASYLPGLTNEVIGSVIILGQGLPHKFSNHTPSGRKELLEKLSKSDFMIEDIKKRIDSRQLTLQQQIRELDNALLQLSTKKSLYSQQLSSMQTELDDLLATTNYDELIANEQAQMDAYNNEINQCRQHLDEERKCLSELTTSLATCSNKLNEELQVISKDFNAKETELTNRINDLKNQIYVLNSEIKRLDSITDICPTCHQKIVGVEKPDTTQQKEQLKKLQESCRLLSAELVDLSRQYNSDCDNTRARYDASAINKDIQTQNRLIYELDTQLNTMMDIYYQHSHLLNQYIAQKASFVANKEKLEKSIKSLQETIDSVDTETTSKTLAKEKLNKHLEVIVKMNTLIKRDFRGFLLTNVIEFISKQVKEYSKYILGSTDIVFELDGNNIDISYCGKDFDNLSGGEKQKIDLVLQFALRSMMNQYLGFSCNCLFLDEIFDGLDSLSCDNLIKLITEKLYDISSVFIISHRSDTLGLPNDNEIIVEKNEKGISEIK